MASGLTSTPGLLRRVGAEWKAPRQLTGKALGEILVAGIDDAIGQRLAARAQGLAHVIAPL